MRNYMYTTIQPCSVWVWGAWFADESVGGCCSIPLIFYLFK